MQLTVSPLVAAFTPLLPSSPLCPSAPLAIMSNAPLTEPANISTDSSSTNTQTNYTQSNYKILVTYRDAGEKFIGTSKKQSKPWIGDKTWEKIKERREKERKWKVQDVKR